MLHAKLYISDKGTLLYLFTYTVYLNMAQELFICEEFTDEANLTNVRVNKPLVYTAYVGLGKGVIKKGRTVQHRIYIDEARLWTEI